MSVWILGLTPNFARFFTTVVYYLSTNYIQEPDEVLRQVLGGWLILGGNAVNQGC